MAKKTIKLKNREDWRTPGGIAPLRCVLVGGASYHANVGRIVDKLWSEFGITVVRHEVRMGLPAEGEPSYDLAVIMIDQCSHTISSWGRSAAHKSVTVPSSWSEVVTALHAIGLLRVTGDQFQPPAEEEQEELDYETDQGPLPDVPQPSPELLAELEENDMTVVQPKEFVPPTPKVGLSKEMKDLLLLVKQELLDNNIRTITLEIGNQMDEDVLLLVDFERVIIERGQVEL